MWTYIQRTGQMLDANGDELTRGYSGHWDGVPPAGGPSDHRNRPADQALKNIGPIPVGRYTIGAAYDDVRPHGKGPVVMALTPDPANEMFGRDDFLIHGDRAPPLSGTASDGCIILDRDSRRAIARSNDRTLQVIAEPAMPIAEFVAPAKRGMPKKKAGAGAAKPKARKAAVKAVRKTSHKPASAKRGAAKPAKKAASKRAAPAAKKAARKTARRRR